MRIGGAFLPAGSRRTREPTPRGGAAAARDQNSHALLAAAFPAPGERAQPGPRRGARGAVTTTGVAAWRTDAKRGKRKHVLSPLMRYRESVQLSPQEKFQAFGVMTHAATAECKPGGAETEAKQLSSLRRLVSGGSLPSMWSAQTEYGIESTGDQRRATQAGDGW